MPFTFQQFTQAFDLRDAEDLPCVLIGGQAINYWAETYLAQEPTLANWLPFTSEDIDLRGGRDDVIRAAKKLGVRARLPHSKEMTALAGIVPFKIGDLETTIDFVRTIPGFPNHKIDAWAVTAELDGKKIRVLDPISLLCCKAHLALKVDQKERRDIDHFRMMLICTRAFLRETLCGVQAGQLPPRGWLGAVERVLKLAESTLGRRAVRKLGVKWAHALPESDIANSVRPAAIQLCEKRLPRWWDKLLQ